MLNEIKILLGETANNFTDEQIEMALKMAIAEIEDYCGRECDNSLLLTAEKMVVVKLNKIHTEGIQSQSFSGISETYIDGYPSEIMMVLNRKRKIKTI